MKEGTRFEVCGAVAEKPVGMVNFDGSPAYVEVRLKVAGRQRVHEFGVRVVDKGKAGALEGLAVGTRLLARGRMSGELYKGFYNVHLYADEVMVELGADAPQDGKEGER